MRRRWKVLRQQDKVIIWPIYFDLTKTRKHGRRVPKNIGVPSPRLQELKEAADKLRIENELVPDVAYPASPSTKTGMLLVKKKVPKEETIKDLALALVKIRSISAIDQKTKS